jgi:hypothetical protein
VGGISSAATIVLAMSLSARGRGLIGGALAAGALTALGCAPELPRLDDPPPVVRIGKPCRTRPVPSYQAPVATLWCDVERGDLAAAANAYDSRVRSLLGREALIGTLRAIRRLGSYRRGEIADVQSTKLVGPTIIARVGSLKGKPTIAIYRVQRRGGRWSITFDSVLRWVMGRTARRSVPDSGTVPAWRVPRFSPATIRRYDRLFGDGLGR